MPVAGEQVWFWFRELDSQRTGNGYGPNALGFQAIADWCRLRCIRLQQWQLDALLEMDIERRRVLSDESENSGKAEEAVVSDRPMTMALFDALF